jgi:hypothetical protein
LAPAIHARLVVLVAIDPEGGMELAFGRPLYQTFATTAADIADALEQVVDHLRARTARLAGRTRLHTPSAAEPLVVVLVDEIATITAYIQDRDLKRRIAGALGGLLSQGRAPGFVVIGAVQDPRKEIVPMRGQVAAVVHQRPGPYSGKTGQPIFRPPVDRAGETRNRLGRSSVFLVQDGPPVAGSVHYVLVDLGLGQAREFLVLTVTVAATFSPHHPYVIGTRLDPCHRGFPPRVPPEKTIVRPRAPR